MWNEFLVFTSEGYFSNTDITKMKLWSLRSAYNNYEIIVVTAWSWMDTSTFVVASCVPNGSVAKYYLGGSNTNQWNLHKKAAN